MKYLSIAIIILIFQISAIVGMPKLMSVFISPADHNVVKLTIESILRNDFGVLTRGKVVNLKYENEFRSESQEWITKLNDKPISYELKTRKKTGEQKNYKESVYLLKMPKNKKLELLILTEISSGEEIVEKINIMKAKSLQSQWKVILKDYLLNITVFSLIVFLWDLIRSRSKKAKK